MGLTTEQLFSTRPTAGTNTTQATTPASSSSSVSSLLGANGLSGAAKQTKQETESENKNSSLGVIARGVGQLLPSIGKGVTSAIDSIADAPSSIGNAIAQSSAKKDPTNIEKKFNARMSEKKYQKASSQHVLGDSVQQWENKVDEAQQQIVTDNPTSKTATVTAKALELGEAVGEMAPSIAAAVVTGGIGGAAIGGASAAATAAAKGVTGAAKAISRVRKLSQAAGLGTMFTNVYDKSFDDAVAQGNDYDTSGKKAFGDAALEVGTELLFGGIAGLGQGIVSSAAKQAASKSLSTAAASEGAQKLIKMQGVKNAGVNLAKLVVRASEAAEQSTGLKRLLINSAGEGAEEMISEFFGPFIERATTNPNASDATIGEMLEAGLGGALISFAMAPLGRLHSSKTTTSADVQQKAKLQYILSDTKQQVALMRNIVNDTATGEVQVQATEQLLGTELAQKNYGTGLEIGVGILQPARRNLANRIITEAEHKNTADAMSEAWGKLRELYEAESQYRMDKAAHEKLQGSLTDKAVTKDAAVAKAQARLDAAKAEFSAVEKGKDAAQIAKAQAAVTSAQNALNEASKQAKKQLPKKLRRTDAVEKYGEETVDAFTASARYLAARDGAVVTDADGTQRVMTREQYSYANYGKAYDRTSKDERAEIDRVFKEYQESVRREQDAFVKKLNDQAAKLNNGIKIKFSDEVGGIPDGFNASYRHDINTIVFNRDVVQSEEAANYYLSHELLHNLSDRFMSQEQRAAFYRDLRTMMEDVGVDYNALFRAVAARYDEAYSRRAAKAADQKNLKGTARKHYIEAYLYDKFTEETYARFMQTAFGSESILQTLAQENHDLVKQMRESVQYSSLKALYGSEWDYARLSALDKINRALASPVDAETNREKNAEALDSGMAELYSLSKNNEKEETRDGKGQRLFAHDNRPDTARGHVSRRAGKLQATGKGHAGTEQGPSRQEIVRDNAGGIRDAGQSLHRLPDGDWTADGVVFGYLPKDVASWLRGPMYDGQSALRILQSDADLPAQYRPYVDASRAIRDFDARRAAALGQQPCGKTYYTLSPLYDQLGPALGGFYRPSSNDIYVSIGDDMFAQNPYNAVLTLMHESFHLLADVRKDPMLLGDMWTNAAKQGIFSDDELRDVADRLLSWYRFDASDNAPGKWYVANEFFAALIEGNSASDTSSLSVMEKEKLKQLRHWMYGYLQDYADKNGIGVDFLSMEDVLTPDAVDSAYKQVLYDEVQPIVNYWAEQMNTTPDRIGLRFGEPEFSYSAQWGVFVGLKDERGEMGEPFAQYDFQSPEKPGGSVRFYEMVRDDGGWYNPNHQREEDEFVAARDAKRAVRRAEATGLSAEERRAKGRQWAAEDEAEREAALAAFEAEESKQKREPTDDDLYRNMLTQMSDREIVAAYVSEVEKRELDPNDVVPVTPDKIPTLMAERLKYFKQCAQQVKGTVFDPSVSYEDFVRRTGVKSKSEYFLVNSLGRMVAGLPYAATNESTQNFQITARRLSHYFSQVLGFGSACPEFKNWLEKRAGPNHVANHQREWRIDGNPAYVAQGYIRLQMAQERSQTVYALDMHTEALTQDVHNLRVQFRDVNQLRQRLINRLPDLYESYSSDLAVGYSPMTEERMRQYDALRQKYGEYEGGAPKRTSDHTAVNKTAADIIGGGDTPEEFADVMRSRLLDGAFSHIVMTDANATASARELLSSFSTLGEAYNAAVNTMFDNHHTVNKNDIVFGEQLIVDMAQRIRDIEGGTTAPNESTDTTELFDQLQHLIAQVCSAGTRAGQNLQAFSLLKKLTPTGRLYYINSQIEAFVSEMTDRNGQSRVGGFKFKRGSDGTYIKDINGHYVPLRVDPEIQEELLSCTTKEELDAAEEKALENLASKIPPSLEDRVVAWRYLAMLGNPRTHIRNIVSNYAMGAAVSVKDKLAGHIEDTALRGKTEGRTKTGRSISSEERTALGEFVKRDWENGVRDQTLTGGKVGFENRLNDKRRKLDGSLDRLAKKNTALLEHEDETAALRAYKRAFSNYAAANGLSVAYLSSGTMEANVALAQARRYAASEAQKATYRDASTIATLLNQLEKKNTVSKIVVGGLVPFKKTPINILSRGVTYSPIGLVKGAANWMRAATSTNHIDIIDTEGKTRRLNRDGYAKEKYGKGYKDLDTKQRSEVDERFLLDNWTGAFDATNSTDALDLDRADDRRTARAKQTLAVANAIDELAAGLTGTGILLLGILLSRLGMLKGAGSDDDTEEYYDQMLGNQEYSVTIGGKNITLDWLTPISMPLFAGAAIDELCSDELEFSELAESIARIADPVTNLSVLQGINDAMSSYDSDIGQFVTSAGSGWLSQFVPTAAGQLARSLDETRRTTYAPKDAEGGKQLATFVNKIENKMPGLSQTNAAYVDQWGRHETNSGESFVERLINNAVVPWYSRDINRTVADDYITALRDETGNTDVLPASPKSYYTFGNETFYLASDEYQTTKELVGQLSNTGINSLMAVPGFAQLSAEDQAELVSEVYYFAKNIARADYASAKGIDYEMSSSTAKTVNAVAAGMSIGAALYAQFMASSIAADKDASGKTIRNSRKNKLYDFYTSLGLTLDQINAIAPYEYD